VSGNSPGQSTSREAYGLDAPASDAEAELGARIAEGESLLWRPVADRNELARLIHDYQRWSGENRDLLRRLFLRPGPALEYAAFHGRPESKDDSLSAALADCRSDLQTKLARLRSITTAVALHPGGSTPHSALPASPDGRARVILLAGDDDRLTNEVAGVLRERHLEVVAIHAGRARVTAALDGRTASAPVYAVVVLTPLVREEITFPLGYMIGAVGPTNVTVLWSAGAVLPSDLAGLAYIPLDAAGTWKRLLAERLALSAAA
jgi:hypothetical protein